MDIDQFVFNQSQQVITCEGNAGFYEVGLMNTPLKGLLYFAVHCAIYAKLAVSSIEINLLIVYKQCIPVLFIVAVG